jgi:hypothetical protein
VFPISLTMAGMVTCIYSAFRSSWRLAPIAAFAARAVAASAYVSALVLCPALLLGLILTRRGRRLTVLSGAAGVAAGFAGVLITARVSVGIWNGYFIAQRKYATGSHDPFAAFRRHLSALWTPDAPPLREAIAAHTAYTAVLLAALVAVFLAVGVKALVRARRSAAADRTAG